MCKNIVFAQGLKVLVPKCNSNTNMCDGISNFEPGMTLGQNSWVFIVIGTATPSVKSGWGCPKNRLQK